MTRRIASFIANAISIVVVFLRFGVVVAGDGHVVGDRHVVGNRN